MKQRALLIVFVSAAACAAYAGYLFHAHRRAGPTVEAPVMAAPELDSRPLTHWSFDDLSGRERHMSEWAGDLVVVNFWATWCAPCRKEIPGFITLQERYAGERVQFVGIALDQLDAVRGYAEEEGINYPLLIGEEAVFQYMRALGNTIGALPFSAIIGRDGRVLTTHQGEWARDAVDGAIREAL
ncbi:MAG TPA: TlpA disulfide reductase family protein [Gammaproteobacteria bacterium]|nr:TlpA disulfide reductase family protein [Gammaproteobacteria bacterium]